MEDVEEEDTEHNAGVVVQLPKTCCGAGMAVWMWVLGIGFVVASSGLLFSVGKKIMWGEAVVVRKGGFCCVRGICGKNFWVLSESLLV